MAQSNSESKGLSMGWLVFFFILFLTILWKFTDLFTSILGTILLIAVFVVDYNRRNGLIH